MKAFVKGICIAAFIFFLQSCTGTRRFGTTIERDENNPCQVNMIIQVGVQGTDADVATVKSALEECYKKECFIPCDKDSSKGCMTKITVVVKKWGSLSEDEQKGFHYVNMVDDDSLPSNAYIGTPNNGTSSGTWRRNQPAGTYCHEVLHFCGLRDKYCARIYDPVTDSLWVERICDPPPEPGAGTCCLPFGAITRCSTPCSGHEDDMMGTSRAGLSCENIMDVLKGAGFDKCPVECCNNSNQTFTRPPDEAYLMPGYLHFGDKDAKFGTFGLGIGFTKMIGKTVGLTIDGGYYTRTKKETDIKSVTGISNITGGITWLPPVKSKMGLSVSTHALAGISIYNLRATVQGLGNYNNTATSFHFNIGAALNLALNKHFNIRLLQADYAPSFLFDGTQHNYRLSAGVVYKIVRK